MRSESNAPPDFKALFESSPQLSLVLDRNLVIVAVSDAYLRATMTKREEILGKGIFEVFPDNPNDPAADGERNLRASLRRVLEKRAADTMAVQRYDIRLPASEGGAFVERYWSPSNTPTLGPDGEVRYIYHCVEDVTANVLLKREAVRQKKATEELSASERKFRALLESAPDAMVIAGRDGRIELVNACAEALFGYQRRELIGMPADDLIAGWHEHIEAGKSAGPGPDTRVMTGAGKLFGLHKNGDEFPVEISHGQMEIEEGTWIMCAVRDIGARLRLEEQIRQSQKMEAVGQLTGGVAHDFNNLLTVILGRGDLLLARHDLPDAVRKEIQMIVRTGERAATLTKQLLQFSRRQVLQPKVLDLNGCVHETVEMLGRLLGENIELSTKSSPEPAFVRVDPGQFQQVLLNLAVNARDAMPSGGVLSIEVSLVNLDEEYAAIHEGVQPGSYVLLAMSDTGVGMDEKTRRRIFEPFFTTKGVGAGTGLGLATVHGIVNQSGGHIWVYSEPGKGTTFKIYFPCTTPGSEANHAPAVRRASAACTETILVVEDETSIRELMETILGAQGYTVLVAKDGETALNLSEAHVGPIHLLLTDVVMPGISGGELAIAMKIRRPRLKILYMSGYTSNAIVHHGVLDEGITFLEKPFTHSSVTAKVRELLDATD
ncbi:MAG: PAS domain S-box protein [Planctomycetes bacterium]|nr:PAS domain S-box protein [Planctomycetota bacterium]